MQKQYLYPSYSNYTKALVRLQKSIRSGRFASYTHQKKWQIWNRLCRYARQLGIKIKAPVAAACLAAGLSFATPAAAQTFSQKTGPGNPFNGVNFGSSAAPALVDIDGDGDLDAFVGAGDGTIRYFKNTGTATSPVFTEITGVANPFNGVTVGSYCKPSFVDIDGDGDMDAFIGAGDGSISYYKNTGSKIAPVFTVQTGGNNPLDINVGSGGYAAPTFVDIDGDGDMDAFIGSYYGTTITYYKNIGSATAPNFILESGAANPFDGVDSGFYYSTPTFVDIDGDGDMDAFIGDAYGTIRYYKNIGSATAPVFAAQTGPLNPFDGVDIGSFSAPAFGDIDGDGDQDVFIGADDGTISYFQNTSINLPLHLLSFSGNRQAGYNQLQWRTAGEINTKLFELEMSIDGRSFTKIATINAAGSGGSNYSSNDYAVYNSKVFYRLKMVDIDARFTYSPVIWINSEHDGGVTIYPNPVTDVLNINIGKAKILKTNAGIYDANGRLAQNILINSDQQQIDLRISKGVYVIKFADGTVQSFIKE